ncbi:MAG: ABC-2 transporter permease [Slackia faecicanis]|nr:ABC-2 transporter permease [Slackia faecicanis]
MKAAFLSEFITSKSVLAQSAVIYVVVALVIGVSMQSPVALVACLGAMTPFMMVFTFCALDGVNGWERFRATLPVSRAAIVASRYANILAASFFMLVVGWVIALALAAAASLLPFDAQAVASFSREASDPAMLLCAGAMGMGVTLLAASFILPFALRFGMTKSIRIVPVVAILLLPASIFLMQQVPDLARMLSEASLWLDRNVVLATVVFMAAVLAVYAASCAAAVAMYRNKEL